MKKRLKIFAFIFLLGINWIVAQQSLLWAKGMDGTASAMGIGIAADASNNIYNVGQFSGVVDFDPGPAVTSLTAIGNSDIFLSKYDPSGNLIWVKQMGGAGNQNYGHAIVIDNAGVPCITGVYTGTTDFDPNIGVFNMSSIGGSTDIFIAKYDQNGNLIWAKSVGANTPDIAYDIDVDATNNVYTTGHFYGTVDFDPGSAVANSTVNGGGQRDVFILKLDPSGNYIWCKQVGSAFDDSGGAIHIDNFGNTWCAGYYGSTCDFDPGSGTVSIPCGAGYSGFILALDPAGNYANIKTFIAPAGGQVIVEKIVTDATGNIYTSGFFTGAADFDPSGSIYNLNGAINDVFISKLDPTGSFLWARSIGGSGNDLGWGLTLDADNNVYTTGSFGGPGDFDPGPGTYSLTPAGGSDIFISKLDASGNFLCAGAFGGTGNESGQSIAIDNHGNILNTGYYSGISDFDPSINTNTLSATGSIDIFISKYAKHITGSPLSYTICSGVTLTLTGNSASTFSWLPPSGLSSTTGTSVLATPTINTTYTVDGAGGCFNTTTLIAVAVKPKPSFAPPLSPQKIDCIPDSILLQSTSTNTNVTLNWRLDINNSYTSQPFYAKNPGNYYAKATDNNVGCADSTLIIVNNNKIPPNSKITSHSYVNALTPLDTITCYQPAVTITGASDTANVIISWKSVANNSVFTNPVNITMGNNLKLIVKRNNNGCSDSSIVALVNQDNALPNAIITSTLNTQLNCSVYSASVSAAFSPTNCTSFWKTPTSSTITNPSTVFSGGNYKLTVTNPVNGCVKLDSINISQTNSILMNVSPDFTICKNSPTTLSAQAIGTLSGVSYSWTGGQTGSSITVSTALSTNFIVTAASGSCVGTATVKVNIPPDIQDSVIAYRSCNDNTTGTIIMFAKGGISPYKYSIDNGVTYSTINSFTSLPFGVYNIAIKDSIGCVRQSTASVSPGSSLPVPKFLASTKNQMGDTIVLVDISIPKPDSVQWIFPSNISKIGGTMFSPIIISADTGNFTITMKGYYGLCIINATKLVRFAPYDSLVANHKNAHGIKTFSLYPNPNTGQFTVFVEFYKKQNASIQVWDMSPYKHFQQNYYDVVSITLPVDVSFLQNGGYLLRVIAEYDAKNKPFIISK